MSDHAAGGHEPKKDGKAVIHAIEHEVAEIKEFIEHKIPELEAKANEIYAEFLREAQNDLQNDPERQALVAQDQQHQNQITELERARNEATQQLTQAQERMQLAEAARSREKITKLNEIVSVLKKLDTVLSNIANELENIGRVEEGLLDVINQDLANLKVVVNRDLRVLKGENVTIDIIDMIKILKTLRTELKNNKRNLKNGIWYLNRRVKEEARFSKKISDLINKLETSTDLSENDRSNIEKLKTKLSNAVTWLVGWEGQLNDDVREESSLEVPLEVEIDDLFTDLNKDIFSTWSKGRKTAEIKSEIEGSRTKLTEFNRIKEKVIRLVNDSNSFLNVIGRNDTHIRDARSALQQLNALVVECRSIIAEMEVEERNEEQGN